MRRYFLLTVIMLMLLPASAFAKDDLVVKTLEAQVGITKPMAKALSDVVKDALSRYYNVQSMEDLAAITGIVEDKLKAGCDDTQCIMDVAGALNVDRVAVGSISKIGSTYRFSLRLIKSRGKDAGVKRRASHECKSEDELIDSAKRVALKLIGKTPGEISAKADNDQKDRISRGRGKSFTNTIGQKFLYIEPGSFMMGSPSSEDGRFDDETQHRVTLTKGYYMQTTEVTQKQWQEIMGNNPSRFSGCSDCPVEKVSWEEVQEFTKKLNQKEGKTYRLPTEAEWEYACRAGTTGAYAGDLDAMGWYWDNSGKKTHPVAQKRANARGLYDMHGNVYEWCQDWYRKDYGSYSATDPTGPSGGSYRVDRGGSWSGSARSCRSAFRLNCSPGYRNSRLGFRLCSAGHQE